MTDDEGQLAYPGEIHNKVQKELIAYLYSIDVTAQAECIIDYENGWWGRADIISTDGRVWEIKRDRKNQIKRGRTQVNKYINGIWRNHREVFLREGDYIPSGQFQYKSGDTTYYVKYEYKGNGIVAYDYDTKTDWESVSEKTLAVFFVAGAAAKLFVSFGQSASDFQQAIDNLERAFCY